MGTKGPCSHCGIEDSPIWMTGPLEKPVLCNVCGSWWKTIGTLDGYIRREAKDIIKISHGPSFSFGSTTVGQGLSPFVFNAGTCPVGSSSGITMSENNTQTQNVEEEIHTPFSEPNNITPWKNESIFEQQVSSTTERLQQQLHITKEEQYIGNKENPESVLIFERINKYIPENEIGLGCMLLKPGWDSNKRN